MKGFFFKLYFDLVFQLSSKENCSKYGCIGLFFGSWRQKYRIGSANSSIVMVLSSRYVKYRI